LQLRSPWAACLAQAKLAQASCHGFCEEKPQHVDLALDIVCYASLDWLIGITGRPCGAPNGSAFNTHPILIKLTAFHYQHASRPRRCCPAPPVRQQDAIGLRSERVSRRESVFWRQKPRQVFSALCLHECDFCKIKKTPATSPPKLFNFSKRKGGPPAYSRIIGRGPRFARRFPQ